MNEEVKTESFELETKNFEIEKSYLTKEEFTNMLNFIDFISIKECHIEMITGFIVNIEKNSIQPLTKNIDIN